MAALTYTITAVPSRTAAVEHLVRRLDKQLRNAPQVEFLGVTWDEKGEGVWPTTRRAWLAGASAGSRHHLVLQDDVEPCEDFLLAASHLLALAGDVPVTFYTALGAQHQAKDGRWLLIKNWINAQALGMESQLALSMVRWIDDHIDPGIRTADGRMGTFFDCFDMRVLCPCPSLVEHRLELKSALGNPPKVGGRERRAARFIGADASAMLVEWSHPLRDGNDVRRVNQGSAPLPLKSWS